MRTPRPAFAWPRGDFSMVPARRENAARDTTGLAGGCRLRWLGADEGAVGDDGPGGGGTGAIPLGLGFGRGLGDDPGVVGRVADGAGLVGGGTGGAAGLVGGGLGGGAGLVVGGGLGGGAGGVVGGTGGGAGGVCVGFGDGVIGVGVGHGHRHIGQMGQHEDQAGCCDAAIWRTVGASGLAPWPSAADKCTGMRARISGEARANAAWTARTPALNGRRSRRPRWPVVPGR